MILIVALTLFLTDTDASERTSARQEADPATGAEWRRRGLELGYNLDHADAIAAFQHAVEAEPTSPTGYRLLAAAAWTALLFEQGAITVEDFLGEARRDYRRSPPRADLAQIVRTSLDRAIVIAEQQLKERPNDLAAHYHAGAAYSFRAAYTATVEGRLVGSFGAARRAYREHQHLLERDPSRKDAGLIVGMYRYTVASFSAPLRLGALLAGFGGGRERGLRMVEEAASYPSDVQRNAQMVLILIYNRAGRYHDALRVIRELQQRYPRNRLLWLEEAGTALRARRLAEARTAIEAGLARLPGDGRTRAPGEEARWRYTHGAILVALRHTELARTELDAALGASTRDWLRGRIHLEQGKLADLSSDRTRAREQYRDAARLCREDDDSICEKEASALSRTGYR